MTARHKFMIAAATLAIAAAPALAGPGGNGQGNGGNSSSAGSKGHGAATSAAARDPSTSGLTKALGVVGSTPASPQATLSLQAAFDKLFARNETAADSEPDPAIETVE